MKWSRHFVTSTEYADRSDTPLDARTRKTSLDGAPFFAPSSDPAFPPLAAGVVYKTPCRLGPNGMSFEKGSASSISGRISGISRYWAARKVGASGLVIAVEPLIGNLKLLLTKHPREQVRKRKGPPVCRFGDSRITGHTRPRGGSDD